MNTFISILKGLFLSYVVVCFFVNLPNIIVIISDFIGNIYEKLSRCKK